MKGDYFVNKECIRCEVCVDFAPVHFGIKNDRIYVKKQPKTKRERADCMEAKVSCPVEAIKRRLK